MILSFPRPFHHTERKCLITRLLRAHRTGAPGYSPECVEGKFSEVRRYGVLRSSRRFYRKNNTGTIERRLRSARSQQTRKKIASKVMYDSWLLEWTNNNPEEITNPLSSTAAVLRTGPTSKTYQNSTP